MLLHDSEIAGGPNHKLNTDSKCFTNQEKCVMVIFNIKKCKIIGDNSLGIIECS